MENLVAQPSQVITYESVRRMALTLPNVSEGSSYGTPALKVKGKLFIRLLESKESIVIKMPFEQRDELMAADPATYYITDHYRDYEWMLVRLSRVQADALRELLKIAHRTASRTIRRGRRSDTDQRSP
jgi:hypothetical protein